MVLGWRDAIWRECLDLDEEPELTRQRVLVRDGVVGVVSDRAIGASTRLVQLGVGGAEECVNAESARALPTPTVAVVLAGVDSPAGHAVLLHLIRVRESWLHSRGVYVALVALIARGGGIVPATEGRATPEDDRVSVSSWALLDPRRPGAPHGGLDDTTLTAVLESCGDGGACGLADECARLQAILTRAAVASFVLIDASGRVPSLLAQCTFSLARYAARCIAIDTIGCEACDGDSPYVTWLPRESSAEALCEAAWRVWTGALPPLVHVERGCSLVAQDRTEQESLAGGEGKGEEGSTAAVEFARRCLVCGERQAMPRLCGGCLAVCFCSERCQLAEMRNDAGLPHAAYCALFRRMREADISQPSDIFTVQGKSVSADSSSEGCGDSLPRPGDEEDATADDEAPPWLLACTDRRVMAADTICKRLQRAGTHHGAFKLICRCDAAPPVSTWRGTCPPTAPAAHGEEAVCTWPTAYQRLGLCQTSPAALLLSMPATLCHVIRLCQLHAPPNGQLSVHCIGASEAEESVASLYSDVVFALLPRVRLHITMVGPMLSSRPSLLSHGPNGSELRIDFLHGLYHERRSHSSGTAQASHAEAERSTNVAGELISASSINAERDDSLAHLGRPDLAIAHNAGIAEYASWHPTLALLLTDRHVPFCFTSYCECEVLAASVVFREHHGWQTPLLPLLNPFRQPLERASILTGGALDIPWSSNRVLTLINHSPDTSGVG